MYDKLVYAMSTRSSLSLERFKDIFRKVYTPGQTYEDEPTDIDMRRQAIRSLDSLGYCEFDFTGRTVHMCPPCLLLLPGRGIPRAVFAGARTPSLINKLKEAVRTRKKQALISQVSQSRGNVNGPATIIVEAIDKETLLRIGNDAAIETNLDQPAAWKLANISISADNMKESLRFNEMQEPNWPRRVFRKDRLVFSATTRRFQDRVQLAEYTNPVDRQRRHWLWDGEEAAGVERDWGRYIALSIKKHSVMLYHERSKRLAVPVTVPVPCLLSRALALCSGSIPVSSKAGEAPIASIPPGHPLHIYTDIPVGIAELAAGKLRQRLVPVDLENINNGVGNG